MKYSFPMTLIIALVCLAWPAAAQDAPGVVDISPITSYLVEVLAAVAVVVGGWAVRRIFQWIGIKRDEKDQAQIENLIGLGINFGKVRLQEIATKRSKIEIKNELVRFGAGYVIDALPGILQRQKITPEKVGEMVKARLPKLAPEVTPDDATATLIE